MSEYRSRRTETIVAAVVVLAMVMSVAIVLTVTDVEAVEGESIEYRTSSTNQVVIYDSPVLDGLINEVFNATVTDSSGKEYTAVPDDTPGVVFFAPVSDRGCVVTLTENLSDGWYNVHIYTQDEDLYNGPLIVGEASLEISDHSITNGESVQFSDLLEATPKEMADQVHWTSDDPNVLRITDEGVQAVGVGKAIITATYDYIMGDVVATAEITVNPIKVTDSGAYISGQQSVQVGGTVALTLSVDEGASEYSVEWTADPATAVRIVSNGDGTVTVTGNQVTDSVTITATITNYDGTTVTKTHILKVEKVSVTSVEITTADGVSLGINGTTTLEYSVYPENATYKDVTWNSSDSAVATVSENGTITGLKEGCTTITVISKDNTDASDTYNLTVEVVHVDSVTLDKTALTMEVGDTERLVATVLPGTAGDKAVTWTSSNSNVVTVSNGVVTANGLGTATITVTTMDGSKTATCTVEVIEETFTVTFDSDHGTVNPSATSVGPGDSMTFTIVPETGYKVDSVTVGGNVITPVNGVYTVQNIQANVVITIMYVPDVVPEDPDTPEWPDYPYIPSYPDDDYVPLPPSIVAEDSGDDDSTAIAACAAAAVAAAIIAALIVMEYRKR